MIFGSLPPSLVTRRSIYGAPLVRMRYFLLPIPALTKVRKRTLSSSSPASSLSTVIQRVFSRLQEKPPPFSVASSGCNGSQMSRFCEQRSAVSGISIDVYWDSSSLMPCHDISIVVQEILGLHASERSTTDFRFSSVRRVDESSSFNTISYKM